MEPEARRKIEATVMDILRVADMEEMTEFKVRVTASERLGMDLSGIEVKKFIRGVVESFLLSTADEIGGEERKETSPTVREESKEMVQEEQETAQLKRKVDGDGNRFICELSKKRRVTIQDIGGKSFVSIREFYLKDGKQVPAAKGISLTTEQWSTFKKFVPAIDEAVMKMQPKLRSQPGSEVHEQNEAVSNSVAAFTPPQPVPIEISRFDGKNYLCWAAQMEFFLKQYNIAYVLTDPCPSVTLSLQACAEEIAQAKAANQRWVNDDYACRCHILSSLSDHLYYQYSKKTSSAKGLWEELKLVYLYEEFGTKRDLVRKYIEFQMVDDKPIVQQVQELNSIANSIVATGMAIDEKFHVSVIISKFPPSWKDFCIKMMREEYLPFWVLLDNVRVEEESSKPDKKVEPPDFVYFQAQNYALQMRNMKMTPMPRMTWKRQESQSDAKALICYNCGKNGHVSRHCYHRKFDRETNEGKGRDNSSVPAVKVVNNMVHGVVE